MVKFRVLNTFRRGVVLVSVPEGLTLHLKPGDVVTIDDYPASSVIDTRFGIAEREAQARQVPQDEDPSDNRSNYARQTVQLSP